LFIIRLKIRSKEIFVLTNEEIPISTIKIIEDKIIILVLIFKFENIFSPVSYYLKNKKVILKQKQRLHSAKKNQIGKEKDV
jgi:hypothetical protein